jgi:FkbM family methyltransferase
MALTGHFSFGLWLKLHSWPTEWKVIAGKLLSDTDNEFCLRIKNRDTAQLYYGQGDQAVVLHTWVPSAHITTGQWVHLAAVKKQDEHSRLYINGVVRAERDITGLVPALSVNADIELLGCKKEGRFLDASLRHFWLTDKALTSREVCANLVATPADLKKAHYLTPSETTENVNPLEAMELAQAAQNRWIAANRIRSLDYHELINALENETLNIVVVGANDGKNNDPLYDYLANTKRKNTVVLIEPQQQLIPYLEENYRFHPDKHIVNAAVGPQGTMTLYGIKEQYWEQLNVPYAIERNWPPYRAPTGVTSSSKDHVANWLKKHMPDSNPESAITAFTVSSLGLESILETVGAKGEIDVLQIDTEGFDHSVIYNSNIQKTQPKIVFFEIVHLSNKALAELTDYLTSQDYELFHAQENSIALRNKVIRSSSNQPD